MKEAFQGFDCDIVGVSAGFDTYLEDWGRLLKMEDYRRIARPSGKGRRGAAGTGSPCWRADTTRI